MKYWWMLLLVLSGCVTGGEAAQQRADVEVSPSIVEPPSAAEIEQAYQKDDHAWITSRFAGDDSTLNFRDSFTDHWTWQYVGYAFLRSGDYPRATMAFRRVLDIKGDFSPAIYNLACVASLSGSYDQAFELLQLLATRVRPYESLKRKYRDMMVSDADLSALRELPSWNRTAALFE